MKAQTIVSLAIDLLVTILLLKAIALSFGYTKPIDNIDAQANALAALAVSGYLVLHKFIDIHFCNKELNQ